MRGRDSAGEEADGIRERGECTKKVLSVCIIGLHKVFGLSLIMLQIMNCVIFYLYFLLLEFTKISISEQVRMYIQVGGGKVHVGLVVQYS